MNPLPLTSRSLSLNSSRQCLPQFCSMEAPTRWSLLLLIGCLCWSSSWRWQPHIRGCRLLYPLPRAGMRFLTQFFCKMYFLYILSCRKSKKQHFFAIFNPQKTYFLWTPWGQVATLPDLRFHQGRTSNLAKRCPLLFTTLPLCQIWGSIRQNLKSGRVISLWRRREIGHQEAGGDLVGGGEDEEGEGDDVGG